MCIEEYAKLAKRTMTERATLVERWSTFLYDRTSSFEGELALQLAYLWPAIIKGHKIETEERSELVQLLKRTGVPPEDEIWEYIDIVAGDEEEAAPTAH